MRVLMTFMLLLTACSSPEPVDQRLSVLEAQLTQDQARMDQMDAQVDSLVADINDLNAENAALQTSLDQLADLEETEATDLSGLRALIESNDKHLHKHKHKLEKILKLLAAKR